MWLTPSSSVLFWLKKKLTHEIVLLYSSLGNHIPSFRDLSLKPRVSIDHSVPFFLFCEGKTRTHLLMCFWIIWGHPFGESTCYSKCSLGFRIEFFKGQILGSLIWVVILLSSLFLTATFFGICWLTTISGELPALWNRWHSFCLQD